MRISLVMCTRNRAPQLRTALESLRKQECRNGWELVIVDNGSTDETPEMIQRFRAAGVPCALTVATEPRQGLGRARNRGWRLARGEIIAFTDDDCYPAPGFLDAVCTCFDEDSRIGFLGGRILLHDPTDYRITILEHLARIEIRPEDCILPGTIQGANFSFRKTALESVDGFDPDLGAGNRFCCEDTDILARLTAAGWQGAYDPRPVVYHHHGRKTAAEAARLMKQYDRGRGGYYAKNLLNPALRGRYLRYWYWRIRDHQSSAVTARELAAAGEYYLRALLRKFS